MADILMIAYSCDPSSSSEGAVGWQLASRIARRHHVTLLTRPKGRAEIERSIDSAMDLEVEYHELEGLRRLKYLGLPVSNLRYLVWNHRLADRVRQLEQSGRFDIVHHTTWVRHWMPSAAAGARSMPFVWGPVGAAERTPPGLFRTMGWRALVGEALRLIGPALVRLDPLMRRTREQVDVAVASSRETARHLESVGIDHLLAPSVGYDPDLIPHSTTSRNEIVSVGRLLAWKGFHLGLRAFARLEDPSLRYVVIGEGPEQSRLSQLAEELGVKDRVDLTGRLDRDETLRRIGGSRLLVHPSFHDSGGFVVVEALAQGVPVVSLDIGGPSFLIGKSGRAVPPAPSATIVDRLEQAMEQTMLPDGGRSEAARRRAEEVLAWERIVDVYDRIYSKLVDHPA